MKNEFSKKTREKGSLGRRNRMFKFPEARGSMVGLHVFWCELENRAAEAEGGEMGPEGCVKKSGIDFFFFRDGEPWKGFKEKSNPVRFMY